MANMLFKKAQLDMSHLECGEQGEFQMYTSYVLYPKSILRKCPS